MGNLGVRRPVVGCIAWLGVWWEIGWHVALGLLGVLLFAFAGAVIEMKIRIARADRKRERDKREAESDPRNNALAFEVANPLTSFEFKFVGGSLIASDKVLRLTLTDYVGLVRVTVIAFGKEYPAQELVPHSAHVLAPNETQDQRPLARASVAASEVWKSSKARTRRGQRFAASHG